MKSKLKALLGVALTLVLLASLTIGLAVPAAADPGTLKFSTLALPQVGEPGNYWAYPGSDVGAIAVSADGSTLFAAVDGTTGWQVMKSSDGGYAWKVTGFTDGEVVDVAVSPDYEEDLTVFVATGSDVYQSVDGGKMFVQMAAEAWGTETITDLDVALDERGRLAIMVGTLDGTGDGDVYVLSVATAMAWKAQGVGANYDVLACAFSPFFADDEGIATVVTGFVDNFETRVRFSFANTATGGGWGEDIMDARITDANGHPYSSLNASIGFPDDFDPWGIGNNVCFVGTYLETSNGTHGTSVGGAITLPITILDAPTAGTSVGADISNTLPITILDAPTAATLTIGADDGEVTYEAATAGAAGNDITVAHVDPGVASKPLSVDVVGSAITVNLATDVLGDISSTATEVETEVNAATTLVTALHGGSGLGTAAVQEATNLAGGADKNDQFELAVDGAAAVQYDIGAGTYNDGAELETAINTAIAAATATAVWVADHIVFTSDMTGSDSSVVVTAGTNDASVILGFEFPDETSGADKNDQFELAVDGAAAGPYTIAAATYGTGADLVTEINTAIAAATATAVWVTDHIVFISDSFGSTSSVAVTTGVDDASVILGFGPTIPTETSGTDDPTATAGDAYKIVLKEAGTSSAIDLDIRGVITTLLPTETDIVSIDVCGPAEAATILVGTDVSDLTSTLVSPPEQFLVYYSTDSGDSWIPSGTKSPTGGEPVGVPLPTLVFKDAQTQVLMSPDFLTDGIAYAGTFGDGTSAFSRTKDSGTTWNQISLIDYDEYAVSSTGFSAAGYNADGTLRMITTAVGGGGAVWERTGGKNWERIFSYANAGVTDNLSRLIVIPDAIFAVDHAEGCMWRSSDNGATWPKKITTKAGLSTVKAVSATTLYTGHADGEIWWSTRSGVGWTKPDDNENNAMVANIAVSGDFVLVGTHDGKVFISSDGGETVERVGLTNPGGARQITLATFGFGTTDIIYATSVAEWIDGPPPAPVPGGGVWRCEVNYADPAASEWEQIDGFQDTTPYNPAMVEASSPAIALPPSGVLYVTDAAAVVTDDVDGGLWRCTNPTDPDPYSYFEKENKGLDAGDSVGLLDLDVFPTTLFCSVSNATEAGPILYYDQVVMFTDTLDSGVPLADPADKAAGVGTLYEGQWEVDVVLAWAEMTGATKYQYQVAIDKEFASVLPSSGFTAGRVASLDLSPNTTYYWRVRVAYEDAPTENPIGAPLISPWSEGWSFKTVIGPTVARPSLEAPAAGEIDIALSPTFEWSGIEWAEKYEFELGTDPATKAGGYFAAPLVGLTGANALVSTAWKCDIDLDYEGRYYWHVKAIGVDTETPWSDVGTFVTMAKPVLPPEPTAPVVIPPVEEITPAWIWAIIGIGAALIIAVVVLVVTTRRVP